MNQFIDWISKNWPEVLTTSIGIPLIIAFTTYVLRLKRIASKVKRSGDSHEISGQNNLLFTANSEAISNFSNRDILIEKDNKIEDLRPRVSILFIDDDTKFKVVNILKQAGYVQTKIIRDLKTLNDQLLLNAHIVFVDIQGVGKYMQFTDQGLGLAAAIKERYPDKKVIIYSADSDGSRFHKAFRLADDQLSKNAVPYEFENIIETMTIQLDQNGIF